MDIRTLSAELGFDAASGDLTACTPIDGSEIGCAPRDNANTVVAKAERAVAAFAAWRLVPPPKRGELIRLFGEELRRIKAPLGRLVTIEAGKTSVRRLGLD